MLPKISSPAMMFLIFALVPGPEATPQAIQSFNKPRRTNVEGAIFLVKKKQGLFTLPVASAIVL